MKTVRTILLIDDSDDDEFLTRRALKKAEIGSRLIRVADGQEAIEYFSRQGLFADRVQFPDADLVLLDIHMPRVSGFEVLAWIKQHLSEPFPLVIVMISSPQEIRDRDKALGLGAITHCVKPPNPELFANLAQAHRLQWTCPAPV